MINTTIYTDTSEVKRRLGLLSGKSGKVISRAANRACATGKKVMAQEAKKRYLISQKDVNDKKVLKMVPASQTKATATLDYTGGHRNLYLWNSNKAVSPNEIIHWRHGKPNVKIYSAAVARGHGKIKLHGNYGRGTNKPFIQRVRKGEESDFTGLFRRKSNSREAKLESVVAPAIPQILKNKQIIDKFQEAAGQTFQKRLTHEIDAVMKGITK